MKKQLLLLVMILLPMVASGYDFEVNGIYYDIISSTDLTVSIAGGENEYSDDLIIPNEVFFSGRTLKVIGISAGAFSSSKNLTQIRIPDFIISIGSHAFLGCSSLKKVEIEDSETPLAIKANDTFSGIFRLCPLEELYIGRDISVDENQWISPFGLGELKSRRLSIVLGDKVSMLCNNIFSSAKKLYTIIIPENVKYIGESAFEGTSLSTIVIPNGVSEIRKRTFMSCSNLRSVVLSSNTTIIDEYAFYSCSNLTSIELPDVLKQIGKATFGGCKSLSEIILPNDIKQIGEYAFDECNSLTKVISKAPNPPSINDNSFSTTTYWNANLTVPYGTSENYSMANGWKNFDNINEDHSTIPSFRLYYYVNNIEYKSYDLEYGAKITPEPAPTKEGYTFSGWSEIPETMPAHDVIVTGTFTINKYKLTYMVDGTEYKSYELDYGASITPETEPTKEGYTFSGWSEIPETMPAHDVIVTGTFSINSYKLTYMVDGVEYKSCDVEYGATITPEAEPTKEGYTFSGWSEIPETMPAHDVIVTGTFSINSYKLTYMVDGVEYKSCDVEYGATITPEAEPTKEGYTFSGWSEIPETMPAHDVTVIGTFSINSYKLIYTVDGVEYKSYDIEYGATITPEAEPTKEGYTFSGWSTIPETMPAHDVTVTGTFSINKYKLTYTVDSEVYKTYDIEYGATITPEAEPTKEGYTFSGWSTIPETMPAHDVTVTGTFSINKYKLTYTVDSEVYKTYDIEYGATITPEAEPTKEGYTFSGWSTIPTTMPAYDVTITGTFTINKYKLTYVVDGEVYKSYDIEYGSTITPEAEPTKEGYTFSGWSTIPTTMPAYDVTITGSFTKGAYKLTYMLDGVVYKTISYDYGDAITPEPAPVREGYTFSGWSEIPATMPAHDVTVSGTFSINSYKLTYMIDDKVYKETMYEYGATIVPEPQPEGDYETFEWVGLPQTMPAHDVVVNASYTITGIIEMLMSQQQNIRIYSPNGKMLDKPQKGLNIIHYNDGSIRKVVLN